jgi:hypothetical protein
MKIASFLRCGVVIFLSLFAGRVGAQSDSEMLILRFVGHSYFLTFSTQMYYMPEFISAGPGPSFSVTLDSAHNFQYHISNNDTIRDSTDYATYVNFIIDRTNSAFRNIIISFDTFNSGSGGYYTYGSQSSYAVSLDSIHFFLTADSTMKASGSFLSNFYVQAGASGDEGSTEQFVGGVSDTGQEQDSIYLEITSLNSLVANADAISASKLQLLWNAVSNGIVAQFLPTNFPQTLEIADLLGRMVLSMPVSIGAESLQCPLMLPPGCYFARLGDQVAKFVVPPR